MNVTANTDALQSGNSLVSVLIPVYNRETMIATALRSAMTQTYPNIEIIVVDNCSTDRTFEIVQEYARRDQRIRCFCNEKNLGPVRNWMRCLEYSSGEYIKFLFSDDWLAPNAVVRYVEPLLAHPNVGFSYSAVDVHFEENGHIRRLYQMASDQRVRSFAFLKGFITGSLPVPVSPGCALFRRRDIEEALVYDIPNELGLDCGRRGIGNDLLLFLHACASYPQVFYIAKVLAHFRHHSSSITIAHSKSSQRILSQCYQSAFVWFLVSSNLSNKEKRILNTLLFVKMFSIAQRSVPWQTYCEMFPTGYKYKEMSLFNADVWRFAARRIWRKVKSLITS